MRSWIEIDAHRLAHNLGILQRAAGSAEVLAVIKADAYGHSAELCAPVLARAGARWFGVTDAAEGARVRTALSNAGHPLHGPAAPRILVMSGSLPDETPLLAEHSLTPVVWTPDQVRSLSALPQHPLHIEIDTGMSRQGARPGPELDALLAAIRSSGLVLDGVFTHLASSEVAHSPTTAAQTQRLEAAVRQVEASGLRPAWLHIGNSSAVDNPAPVAHGLNALAASIGARPLVRTGLALYGYTLPIEQTRDPHIAPAIQRDLRPVLTWKARVLSIRDLAPGDTVGYGATFAAAAPMRIALLPLGYADGLRRELSNPSPTGTSGGCVLATSPGADPIRCPILGRVSMNLTVADITRAPHLTPGDTLTLLGDGFTADDHARLARTISYEILCALRANPHILTNTTE